MAQGLPLGPGPSLRRTTDQVLTVVGWVVVALAVLTVVCAGVAAASAYRAGLERIERDAAARTTVTGVLLDDAARGVPTRPVRVSYADQQGRPQIGQVSATGRLTAGTPVRIEVDGDGRVGVARPTHGEAVVSAATAGVGTTLVGAILLVLTWCGVRRTVTARNHRAWEHEWRLVEPLWSGRGTAAP
jgi:hypothetical protein